MKVEDSGATREIVIATRNPGKLRELVRLLAGVEARLIGLDEAGVKEEVAEVGSSFEENARMKAEAYARAAGRLVLADDSGLEVDALDGAPGVWSARFGGPGLTDEHRVAHLLDQMREVPGWRRQARFRAVLAIATPERPAESALATGVIEGAITHQPIGRNGFGYDPVFWLPGCACTMAELAGQEKDAISHRGRAARAALPMLQQILHG